MKWKKLGIAGLAALSVLGLAACSSGQTSSAPQGGSSGTQPKVTITFWNEMTGPYETALAKVIANFETKNPNITVKNVVIPNDAALEPKLLAGIVGRSLPTISQLDPQWGSHFIDTNTIVDLTKNIVATPNFGLDQFYPSMLKPGQWPGNKQYMLPFNISNSILIYNKTAFDQAGITSPPVTWSDFSADAAKLSTGNKHAFAVTLIHSYPWRAFFQSAGGNLANASGDPSKKDLSANGAAGKALALWETMAKNGSAILTQGYASQTDFANETSSILVGSSAFYPYITKAVGNKFDIGVAKMPSDKVPGTSADGGYLAMFSQATADQKAAGFKFITYLTSEAGQESWLKNSAGYLAVRKDAVAASSEFLKTHPAQAVALSQVSNAAPAPNYGWYDEFNQHTLIPAIQSVLLGKATANQAADGLYAAAVKAKADK